MADLNKTGFYQTERDVVTCDAFLELSFPAREVLRLFMSQYNGYNNGFIDMASREGAAFLRMSRDAYDKSIKQLVAHGFLIRTFKGRRISETKTIASQWELTCHDRRDASGRTIKATMDYLHWEGVDVSYGDLETVEEAGFKPQRTRSRRKTKSDMLVLSPDVDPEIKQFFNEQFGDVSTSQDSMNPFEDAEDVPF